METQTELKPEWHADATEAYALRLDEGLNRVLITGKPTKKKHPQATEDEAACWTFPAAVNGIVGELYCRSKKLLAMLAQVTPLEWQILEIQRAGKGIKTTYTVKATGQILDPSKGPVQGKLEA